ncbi:MAG: glucose-1-phosphate thymidylyltransferase [Thermoplasmata archaeon]|jgi:glucose-1-phosphate thymidylyltransferase|nr:glucose-1-phosphate thymidylyltransferase [Thermoplasmata archaeon]
MKGLVLSGGYGTRLRPLTHTGPKQLIPIANKPNILYCIEDLRDAGITDIGIILGNVMPEKVQEFLGDGSKFGVRFTYIVQGEPKGIAHAVNCAKDFMGDDPFIVYLGDNLLKNGIGAIPKKMTDEKADCVISLMPVKEPQRYGIAELSPDGKNVVRCVEKPKEPKSNLAVIGVYAFNSSFFKVYPKLKPSWRNEMEITDAISLLIDSGYKVAPHHVVGWWKDTGKPEDILEANHLILDSIQPSNAGKVEEGATVMGRVKIGAGTVIMASSVVRGPAIIGENCRIGPKAYIGPYTAVGDSCQISHAEIDDSIIMDESVVEVEHKLVRTMVGKGSKILSSAGLIPKGERLVVGENTTLYL